MAALQELIERSIKNYREGSIVKGHILEIRPREFLVDIGYKSEGVIPASEFDEPESVEIGDEVENGVRGKRALEIAVALQLRDGWRDDFDFLVAEVAVFTSVWV